MGRVPVLYLKEHLLQLLALSFCSDLIKMDLILCSAMVLYWVQLGWRLKRAKGGGALPLMYPKVGEVWLLALPQPITPP